MALSKFTKDMGIISALDDEPNDVGGLTAAELKAKFDEGGQAIKTFINETLTTEVDSQGTATSQALSQKVDKTTKVNGHPLSEDVTLTKSDVGLGNVDNTADLEKPVSNAMQAALDQKADESELQGVVLGQIPDGSLTPEKFAPGVLNGTNLLINWYFADPINQRGQTSYTAVGNTIDRWKISLNGATLAIQEDGILFTNSTGQAPYFPQILPLETVIRGREYTFSALFAGGSDTKYAEFVCYRTGNPGYSVFGGNAVAGAGLSSVTFTVPEDITLLEARLMTGLFGTTGNFTAVAAKLELGDHQTLAYRDDEGNWRLYEIPDYAEELLKCQYYYVKDAVQIITNSASAAVIQLPRKMRVNPTCTVDVGTFSSATLSTIFVNGIRAITAAIINYSASAEL